MLKHFLFALALIVALTAVPAVMADDLLLGVSTKGGGAGCGPTVVAGATVTYNSTPVVMDANLTVTDPCVPNLGSATVSITSGFLTGDTLNFTNQNGITGTYASGTLTLSGMSSVANYQTALQSVTFSTTAGAGTRTIIWIVNVTGGGAGGATYFITTSGNDTNDGKTIATSWATPNHTLNCSATGGDTILVQPGTYSNGQFLFSFGPPGTGCTGHGVFRTVKCNGTTLGACVINDANYANPGYMMWITTPYWIIQGFQAYSTKGTNQNPNTASGNGGFVANSGQAQGCGLPPTTCNGHDVVYINNWVHDTDRAGFANGDYVAIIGALNYNTGGDGTDSAFDWYEPYPVDTLGGTRIFGAGLFGFRSTPWPLTTDSEGWIFDDWAWGQKGPPACATCTVNPVVYNATGVVVQSLFLGNSSMAVESFNSTLQDKFYVFSTTAYNNDQNTQSSGTSGAEIEASAASLNVDHTLMISTRATGTRCCDSNNQLYSYPIYAFFSQFGSGSITNSDFVNLAVANGSQNYGEQVDPCCIFTRTNNVNVDPQFVNPTMPPVANGNNHTSGPDCSTYATVTACMQGLGYIPGFVTQNPAVAGMGYQPPGACGTDPGNAFWPTWVPIAVVPDGIVTKPCS